MKMKAKIKRVLNSSVLFYNHDDKGVIYFTYNFVMLV